MEMDRRRTVKQRLGLKGLMRCCGATGEHRQQLHPPQQQRQDPSLMDCFSPAPSMNLAAALAAERQLRGGGQSQDQDESINNNNDAVEISSGSIRSTRELGTPLRVSLMMRLVEDGGSGDDGEGEGEGGGVGNDRVCCVCMVRKKGAAFIPCGHTYCRVCSREVWLNRGCCPLCNRSVLDILDIF